MAEYNRERDAQAEAEQNEWPGPDRFVMCQKPLAVFLAEES